MKKKHGTPSQSKSSLWKKTLLCQAVALAGVSMQAPIASALPCAFSPGGNFTVTGPTGSCVLTDDDTLTVLDKGVVEGGVGTGTIDAAVAIQGPGVITGVIIRNRGIIKNNGFAVQGIASDDAFNGEIHNSAVDAIIAGSGMGISIGGALLETGKIINTGTILGAYDSTGGTSLPPQSWGIKINGDIDGIIDNRDGGIISSGADDNFIAVDAEVYGIQALGVIGDGGEVKNAGEIKVDALTDNPLAFLTPADNVDAFAAGINVLGIDGGGYLNNSGEIKTAAVASNNFNILDTDFQIHAVGYGVLIGGVTKTAGGIIDITPGDIDGEFVNTGEIRGHAASVSGNAIAVTSFDINPAAYGVQADAVNGTFTNNGEIVATSEAVNHDSFFVSGVTVKASAHGIEVGDVNIGGLLELGKYSNIKATAKADDLDGFSVGTGSLRAEAHGVEMGDIHGQVKTDGTIRATAIADDQDIIFDSVAKIEARAFGIEAGDIDGTGKGASGRLDNNAEIVVTAEASDNEGVFASISAVVSAQANGIIAGSLLGGQLTNDGSISVSSTANDGIDDIGSAYAYGIQVIEGSLLTKGANVTNKGLIEVTGDGVFVDAIGMYIDGIMVNSSEVVNAKTATIQVDAVGVGSAAYAAGSGIFVNSLGIGAQVYNAGNVLVHASGTGTVGALALVVNIDTWDGLFDNTGYVSAKAETTAGTGFVAAVATAFSGSDDGTGRLDNSGTLLAEANGYGSAALVSAIGVAGLVLEEDAELFNASSGLIEVTAKSTAYADSVTASGKELEELRGLVRNDGYVKVTASGGGADAYGIHVTEEGDVLSGTVENNGYYLVNAIGDEYSPYRVDATVIRADKMRSDGRIKNRNTLVANATAYGSAHARALGIDLDWMRPDSQIVNTGAIYVNAYAEDKAEAVAVRVDELEGLIDSNGIIDADAEGRYIAEAIGISVDWLLDEGRIVHSGTNSLEVIAQAGEITEAGSVVSIGDIAEAEGIAVHQVTGILEHNGLSEVRAFNAYTAEAAGIDVEEIADDGIVTHANSASIYVSAEGVQEVEAIGVEAESIIGNGQLLANGLINVNASIEGGTATSVSYNIFAAGIAVDVLDDTAQLSHEGVIEVYAGTTSSEASYSALAEEQSINQTVIGIYVGEIASSDVTFINNGYVNATTGGDLDSTAYSGWIGDATNGPAIFHNQTSGSMSGGFYSGRNVNVHNAGTIHLPVDQSGRIRHNYEQIDYGTLSIEIDGDGYSTNEYSAWRVDGIMDGDRIEVRVADGARLEEGTLTQVIRAGTLETQDRDDWTVLNSHYLYTFTPDVSIGSKFENVNLWVTSRTFEEALEEDNPRFAKYAKNGAKALDELFSQNTSAAMDIILNSLVNSSAEQVAKFEANMQPITNIIAWYTTQLVMQVSDAIGDRQLRMRDRGIASGDTGTPGEGHVWVKVFGTDTEQDNKGANPGYDADSYGFAIGIDGQVSQEWLLGIAGSYTNADLDYDSPLNQKVEMKGGQLSLYGSFTPTMQDFVDLIVTAGGNDNDTRRVLPATSSTSALRAKGSFDSWYIRGYAGYGHDFIMGQQQDFTLTPVVSLAYTYVDNDSYRESGAGAMNLSVPSEDADTLVLALDLLAAVNFGPRQSVQLSGRVGVGYDFLADNNSNNITATFISDSGTSILGTGIEPDEWVYRAGVGLEVAATERLDLSINYDVQGRKDFVDQFYAANARWAF